MSFSDRPRVGSLPILQAFAGNHTDLVSPFVLLDEFGPIDMSLGQDPLKVGAHPHAGVIPTTYVPEGSGHQKDSLDYDFQIHKGDFMLFSSGKGAIHMEESGRELFEKRKNQPRFSDLAQYTLCLQIHRSEHHCPSRRCHPQGDSGDFEGKSCAR